MYKFTFIIALCLYPPISKGEVAGNVKWDSKDIALTQSEIKSKYVVENVGIVRGVGGNSSVLHEGKLKVTGEEVHIKAEDSANAVCYLPQEVLVYLKLQKRATNLLDKGFANIFDIGTYFSRTTRVMILSRLGFNLADHIKLEKDYYKWDQLRLIATSAIDRLQFLHDAGFIHQDISPKALVYGIEDLKMANKRRNIMGVSLKCKIYLTDLDQATTYEDRAGACIEQSAAKRYTVVEPPFCSRTFRKGLSQSRRDDMEMLGYVLLWIAGVPLPWEGLKNEADITKQQNRLCDDLDILGIMTKSKVTDKRVPAAFSAYFSLLKKLFATEVGFCEKPNYANFKKCFEEWNSEAEFGKAVKRAAK